MDEVVVRRWCDLCVAMNKRTEATTQFTMTIGTFRPRGGGQPLQPRRVDCCDPHGKQIAELRNLIHKVGALPGDTKRSEPAPEPEPDPTCPVCGARPKGLAMTTHLIRRHGARSAMPGRCPNCAFRSAVALKMIQHRTKAHGYNHRQALVDSIPKTRRKKT